MEINHALLPLRIIQITSVTLAIFVFIMKYKIYKCSGYKDKDQLPWLGWLLNFIVFYGLVLLDASANLGIQQLLENPDFFTMWSCILRLHLLGVLFSYTIIHKPFYKGRRK